MTEQYRILWEDEHLLVIDKPSGLRSIPDGYNSALPNLAGLLKAAYGEVWVVHRLDKDTSGVMIFARSAPVHRELNRQFAERETRKLYHAIVVGMPAWESLSIALPLRINGDRKHRTVIDHQTGKPAETEVALLRSLGVFSLLAAQPHTGYTHQIRVHLAALGFPLLADPLYKSLEPETQAHEEARILAVRLPMKRTALHAFQISFRHPVSGEALTFQAPYPQDFRETLDILGKQ